MAKLKDLDIDSIAEIGLMFLNGDEFEEVLLDKYGHVDYDFDKFNHCKKVLMKLERVNRAAKIKAYLWQKRPDNLGMRVPLVAGSTIPSEGSHGNVPIEEATGRAFAGEFGTMATKANGHKAWYYPVKNSDAEIVGILELTCDGEVIS